MSANKGKILAAFMAGLLGLFAIVTFSKGGFFIGKHEGDTLHLLQMLLRMGDGDWPHLDFVTPIGVLAFAPITVFLEAGYGVGQAILAGQFLVAIVFFPVAWWVAKSRFEGGWALLFAATILVYAVALVHGEAHDSVSISMHYNRWAWAAAFLAITTTILPGREGDNPRIDGVVVGLAMAAMALIKVTYFAAFFIPILVGLLARGAWRTVLWAALTGAVAAVVVTLWAGTPLFWLAYLRDLLNVAASDVRPQPGRAFGDVVSAPAYLGGSLVAVLAVIFLRQAGRKAEGLTLLLLVPAFFYVTYQNFGNDPQWLWLLGILLFSMRPNSPVFSGFGWDMQKAISAVALAALCFGTPSFLNMAASPFRHLATDVEDYAALMPGTGVHEDLQTFAPRAYRVDVRRALDGPDTPFAAYYDEKAREDTTVTFKGRTLEFCSLELGMVAWFKTLADDIADWDQGRDKSLFTADLLSSYWMYGDLKPLEGGAPWYYGDLTGIENADYLLLPHCPLSPDTSKKILDEVTGQPWFDAVKEVRRTELYTLYSLPGERPIKVAPPKEPDEETSAQD